jgi:Domain of unknown function (DUF4303)
MPQPKPKSKVKPEFDFTSLKRQILTASVKAFADFRKSYSKEVICSFALYSDEGAMTVGPAFNSEANLARVAKRDPDELDAVRFSPSEWKYESFGAEKQFDAICKRLSDEMLQRTMPFAGFKRELIETCVQALEELRETPALRKSPDIMLMFALSDGDLGAPLTNKHMRRLNASAPCVAEMKRWLASL